MAACMRMSTQPLTEHTVDDGRSWAGAVDASKSTSTVGEEELIVRGAVGVRDLMSISTEPLAEAPGDVSSDESDTGPPIAKLAKTEGLDSVDASTREGRDSEAGGLVHAGY